MTRKRMRGRAEGSRGTKSIRTSGWEQGTAAGVSKVFPRAAAVGRVTVRQQGRFVPFGLCGFRKKESSPNL